MSAPVHWTQVAPRAAASLFPSGITNTGPHPDVVLPVNEDGEPCPFPYDPQQLAGAPLGQYHCPYCGAMCVAGMRHLDYGELLEVLGDFVEGGMPLGEFAGIIEATIPDGGEDQ